MESTKEDEAALLRLSNAALIRLQKDLVDLDLPPCCYLWHPDPDDLFEFSIKLKPGEGFYKDYAFEFEAKVGAEYPIKPPKLKCLTPTFHPNIDTDGSVCLNILREDWKPVLTINSIVYGLLHLFAEPNPLDPLNKEAAHLMRTSESRFQQKVHSFMREQSEDPRYYARRFLK